MAGLFAARVLADHFDSVTVLERDDLSGAAHPRRGIPQDRHFHTLLPGGLEIACGYFPGLAADLAAAGALPARFGQDLVVHRPEGPSYLAATFRPEPLVTSISYFSMSRWLLESVIRNRVGALPPVTILPRSIVRGPVVKDDNVVGVVLDDGEEVHADLVVDASGRIGRSISWLEGLGADAPPESVIECGFGYASAVLRPPEPEALSGVGVLVAPDPSSDTPTRCGYVVRIEDGLWMAGLGGRLGDVPPSDIDGWRAFGRQLSWTGWDELVASAEMVDGIDSFRFPRSIRRHFDRLDTFPEGLLPFGDAICHVNPFYGQGMSSAACQARALDGLLRRRRDDRAPLREIAREFFPLAAEVTRTPWALAAGADLLTPGTVGDFPDEDFDALMHYVQLGSLIGNDPEAAALFVDIFTLRRSLAELEDPKWQERLALCAT